MKDGRDGRDERRERRKKWETGEMGDRQRQREERRETERGKERQRETEREREVGDLFLGHSFKGKNIYPDCGIYRFIYFISSISLAPLQVAFYSEALSNTSCTLCRSFHAEAHRAIVNE